MKSYSADDNSVFSCISSNKSFTVSKNLLVVRFVFFEVLRRVTKLLSFRFVSDSVVI